MPKGTVPFVTLLLVPKGTVPFGVLNYHGWYSRELIDLFERYCRVILDRCHDRVKLWSPIDQINLVSVESYNALGICDG